MFQSLKFTNRTQKFLLETGTRSMLKLLASMGNLVVTYWLVRKLGEEGFGIFRGATASASLVALAGGGMGAAAYGLIVKAVAANDRAQMRNLVAASFGILGTIGLAVVLLAYPAAFGLTKIYGISAENFHSFQITAALAICCLACGFFSMPFVWLVQAHQKEYVLNLFHLPVVVMLPLTQIGIVFWIAEPWSPACGMLFWVVAGNLLCVVICFTLFRWLWPLGKTSDGAKGIWGRTGYGFMEQLAAVLLGQALAWSVTHSSGPAAFGTVAATMTFYAFAKDLFGTMSGTLVAPIGNLFHQGEKLRALEAWLDAVMLLLLVGGALAGTLAIWNKPLVELWLGGRVSVSQAVCLALAASLLLDVVAAPSYAALYAIDGYRERAVLALIHGIGSVFVSWWLGSFLGPLGCVLGLVVAAGVVNIAYPIFIFRRAGLVTPKFWGNFSRMVLSLTLMIGLMAWLWQPERFDWVLLLPAAGMTFLLLAAFLLFVGLCAQSRKKILSRILHLLPNYRFS